MTITKKMAALVVAASILAGAGVAWSQTSSRQAPAAAPRALGGGTPDTIFVPLTPCRLVDTRDSGGKLQLDVPRSFEISGGGSAFAAQGGNPGGCGIPNGANAVEVTITAVDAGSGFLRAWPVGGTQPLATFLNYTDMLNISNTGTLKICVASCVGGDLRLRAFGTPTDVVIDVQGYYQQPLSAVMSSAGSRIRSNRTTAGTRVSEGFYTVTFDRDVSNCAMTASVGAATGAEAATSGFASPKPSNADVKAVQVLTYANNGSLTDRDFNLQVFC